MKEYKVKIVVPLYKTDLKELECDILKNNLEVLKSHKIVFVVPTCLDLELLNKRIDLSSYEFIKVSEDWLGSKKGIEGYNNMMMSKEFYKLFADSEYILICQTDAFIFRDELLEWCNAGYDYIGAPWVKKDTYTKSYVKAYLYVLRLFRRSNVTILKQDLFNKVGNGGLSLRKVDSCIEACDKNHKIITKFAMRNHNLYNEDVFWALMPSDFKYPSVDKALNFSIDSKPELCFNRNNKRLPFGCHGLGQEGIFKFWSRYLHFNKLG